MTRNSEVFSKSKLTLFLKLPEKTQLSGSDKLEGLSSSAMLAEAKDSVESIVDREETVSESETSSSS